MNQNTFAIVSACCAALSIFIIFKFRSLGTSLKRGIEEHGELYIEDGSKFPLGFQLMFCRAGVFFGFYTFFSFALNIVDMFV